MPSTGFIAVQKDGESMLHYATNDSTRPWPGPASMCGTFVDKVLAVFDPGGTTSVCERCKAEREAIITREAEARVPDLLGEALDPTCTCGQRRSQHPLGACTEPTCTCEKFVDKDDIDAPAAA